MPSTTSSSVARDLASSTVITPSLPTLAMAWAIMSPTSLSPLAEIVPTWAISSLDLTFLERFLRSVTTASTALSTPRLRSMGFMPAATDLAPSRTMARASTVAVVVPSPAASLVLEATSRTICAPIFSNLSLSSISFATVTPSLVIRGAPKLLSRTTLRPLGPKVTLTASVSTSMPCSMRSRASVPSRMSLAAMIVLPSVLPSGRAALDETHDVGLFHDHQLLAVDLDFGTRPLAEQHAVARLDVERVHLSVFATGARPDGNDFALHRLFLGGVGDDDPAGRLRLLLHPPDKHAVVQRSQFHEIFPELRD